MNSVLRKSSRWLGIVATTCMALFAGAAAAQVQYIYGNSASSPSNQWIYQIDANTGAVVKSCQFNKGNGRGVVVVGTTVYYTVADLNTVYKADWTTCADQGVAFSVPGVTGIATIAFDGTNFWVNEYNSSQNRAFYLSPTGTLLATITLPNCTSNCDGVEWFQGKLISNRGDALNPSHYDVYSLTGTLLQAALIGPVPYSGTGIAFDGTNFFVSDIFNQRLQVYNGTTGAFVRTVTITGMQPGANVIEDLSVDYQIVLGPPAAPVSTDIPTLSEWALIAMAALLALSAFYYLRRRRIG